MLSGDREKCIYKRVQAQAQTSKIIGCLTNRSALVRQASDGGRVADLTRAPMGVMTNRVEVQLAQARNLATDRHAAVETREAGPSARCTRLTLGSTRSGRWPTLGS